MRVAVILAVCVMCAGAGPATRSTEDELRGIIHQLRAQIAELKRENAALRKGVTSQPTAPAETTLAVGMTLAEANRMIGQDGKLVHKTAAHETYEWEMWIYPTPVRGLPVAQNEPYRDRTIIGTFVQGKLVEFSEHD